ncbi:MAG: tRNA lysidine(34) synthetase TilS [Spirochaetaceae bacterium]|nr:tRNA lysidine(34) synthetase TilS [Spirochaetaceae bacterium]
MKNSKKKDFVAEFLEHTKVGFEKAGLPCKCLFAPGRIVAFGVSGGADSVAMLLASVAIREQLFASYGAKFVAVTINHNIRPQKDCCDDVEFVQKLCHRLNLECCVVELGLDEVAKTAKLRGRGIEEAARFLRYKAFQDVANRYNTSVFCLAHNRNDQLETLVMRFLQGSTSCQGIMPRRDLFCRPFLDISRQSIQLYLNTLGESFCTDKTNFDNNYLRNRLRNKLLPLLDEISPGWDKAVLSGAKKACQDDEYLQMGLREIKWHFLSGDKSTGVFMEKDLFFSQPAAIRRRLIYKAFAEICIEGRFPYGNLEPLLLANCAREVSFPISAVGVEIKLLENNLVVKVLEETDCLQSGFYYEIREPNTFDTPIGCIKIYHSQEHITEKENLFGPFNPPFVLRSPLAGDKIKLNSGKEISLADYFSKFGVQQKKRKLIPVIESFSKETDFVFPLESGFETKSFANKALENGLFIEILDEKL